MSSQVFARIDPVIGFISTWPIYQGTTIDRHAHALMQGVRAAAADRGCGLLMAAGISPSADRGDWRTVWPVLAEDTDFVPVGPWNTRGLIVVPDDLSDDQSRYLEDLQAGGTPVVFTTPEGPGPHVVVDNANGIRAAVAHLAGHGHRRIAFIAGKRHRGGDSAERLRAYGEAIRELGCRADADLIAYGEHRRDGGRLAMETLLARGADFTAFVASNDLSCLGAIQALRAAGRRVPEDAGAVGFDDILDARSHDPPLTTVRHPTFALGYQAVVTLLDRIGSLLPDPRPVVVPTNLIVRQSCGCRADRANRSDLIVDTAGNADGEPSLARLMAENAFGEARFSTLEELEAECDGLVAVLQGGAGLDDRPFADAVGRLLARTDDRGENPQVWESALSSLGRLSAIDGSQDGARTERVAGLLERARLEIGEHVERQTTRTLLEHMDMMSELGLLTSRLLATLEVSETAAILEAHLPRLGIDHALVVRFTEGAEEQPPECEVLLSTGLPVDAVGRRFNAREFPPPGLYPAAPPLQLLVLPLRVDDRAAGFVAFSAGNLEPDAAIVTNLATAIRTSRLYRDAVEGRRMAEEANQLKSRFLSMVSHELRTPLSMVVGLSDMVLRESTESQALSPAAVQDLEHLAASAQHLGRLIGDVLDLASSEAGRLRLVSQPLDLSEVLAAAAAAGERMARDKGLTWQARIPTEVWVLGDQMRLRQICLNLVHNAIKFTSEGAVSLDVEVTPAQVTVSVTDSGIGVPEAEQALIFDEFHRSGRATQGGQGGLGLGLAIARDLVRQHGGSIGVESPGPDGRGSIFRFSIPLIDIPALGAPDGIGEPAVLLLSAAPEAQRGLERALQGRGIPVRVRRVDPGEDWPSDLLDPPPHAVLLDAAAARRTWEVVRSLRARMHGEEIPILAVRLDEKGADGGLLELRYLLKPLEVGALVEELRRLGLLDHGATSGPTILVVDDDPEIVALHERVVQEAGGRALAARNGRQAIEAVIAQQPDLVLLDLGLPDMDGFEVIEAIRSRAASRDLPVIVVTGQTLSDTDIDRLNRGVTAVLSKGLFSPDEIVARIEAALAGRRALGGPTQAVVRRATAFIEAQLGEPITRDDIARHVAISPDYLTDCFHQELGITPIAYLSRCRIRAAKRLLDQTTRSITDIAMEVGFSEVSHFTRTFHREVGVSPRAYRRLDRR